MSERKVAAADQKRVRAFNSEVLTLEKTSLHLKNCCAPDDRGYKTARLGHPGSTVSEWTLAAQIIMSQYTGGLHPVLASRPSAPSEVNARAVVVHEDILCFIECNDESGHGSITV